MIETFHREAELESGAAAVDAARVVIDVLVHRCGGRRIAADREGWMRFDLGSQIAFRMWGVWGRNAWRRMPIKVEARASTRSGGSIVELRLTSDLGPYLFALPIVERGYEAAFAAVVDSTAGGLAALDEGRVPAVPDIELAEPAAAPPPSPGSVNRMLWWTAPSIVALVAAIAVGVNGGVPRQVAVSLSAAVLTVGVFMAIIGLSPSNDRGPRRSASLVTVAVVPIIATLIAVLATWLTNPVFALPVALALAGFLVVQLAWCAGRVVIESRAARSAP